jgi:uncharacterized protein YndB with AHSA1/START domain
MKRFVTFFSFALLSAATMAQSEKACTVKRGFSRTTTVKIEIKATPAIVWGLLTSATNYSRWNSTITSIEGNIALGETIKLKSTLDAKRTFKLKIKEFEPEKRLIWGDAQGTRVFIITAGINGNVLFKMTEKIGGIMFPLYAKMIPPFDEAFDQFAGDLKKESEKIMSAK